MPFFLMTISASKQLIVEADSMEAAYQHEAVDTEEGLMGEIEYEHFSTDAVQESQPDLEQCKRHGLKVFDKDGVEC